MCAFQFCTAGPLAFRVLDQHRGNQRVVPAAFRLQEIVQPRLLRLELLDHAASGAQFVVQCRPLGSLKLPDFGIAVVGKLGRSHALRGFRHFRDGVDECVPEFTREFRATQSCSRRGIEGFQLIRHLQGLPREAIADEKILRFR